MVPGAKKKTRVESDRARGRRRQGTVPRAKKKTRVESGQGTVPRARKKTRVESDRARGRRGHGMVPRAKKKTAEAGGERSEIAFFDVETTVPASLGQGYALLEFGAVLVCPRRLVELGCYSTLIHPADPSAQISPTSVRCNGITPSAVASAPSFQ